MMSFIAFVKADGTVGFWEATNETSAEDLASRVGVTAGEQLWISLGGECRMPIDASQRFRNEWFVNGEKMRPFPWPAVHVFSRPTRDSGLWSIMAFPECAEIDVPPFFVDIPSVAGGVALRDAVLAGLGLEVLSAAVTWRDGSPILDSAVVRRPSTVGGEVPALAVRIVAAPRAIEQAKRRKGVILELVETEASYVRDLEMLEWWSREIRQARVLNERDIQFVFGTLAQIHSAHCGFLAKLRRLEPSYGCLVGAVLGEFGPWFRVAVNYITRHETIVKVIAKASARQRVRRELQRLTREQEGRDLASYLVTPVQRVPRYSLFLGVLKKCTPMSHPDHPYIVAALEALEALLKDMNEQTGVARQEEAFAALKKELGDQLLPGVVRARWSVRVDGSAGEVVVLTDQVLVTRRDLFRTTVVANGKPSRFSFRFMPASQAIGVFQGSPSLAKEAFAVEFGHPAERQAFLNLLAEASNGIAEAACVEAVRLSGGGAERIVVRPRLTCPDAGGEQMVIVADGVVLGISVGGDVAEAVQAPNWRDPGTCAGFVSTGALLYTVSEKEVGAPIPLRWSPASGLPEQRRGSFGKQADRPDARRGASLSQIHWPSNAGGRGLLLQFGGKVGRKYLSELVTIDGANKLTLQAARGPPGRWAHSAAVCGRYLVVSGGSMGGAEALADAWRFDVSRMVWNGQLELSERLKWHASAPIGNGRIAIVGTWVHIIEVEDFSRVVQLMVVGNIPPVRLSAVYPGPGESLWLLDGTKARVVPAAYRLILPERFRELRPSGVASISPQAPPTRSQVQGSALDWVVFILAVLLALVVARWLA